MSNANHDEWLKSGRARDATSSSWKFVQGCACRLRRMVLNRSSLSWQGWGFHCTYMENFHWKLLGTSVTPAETVTV